MGSGNGTARRVQLSYDMTYEKPIPTSTAWKCAIAEGRALYAPRDGGQSYFIECVSAEDAQAMIAKSVRNCFDAERYAFRLVVA